MNIQGHDMKRSLPATGHNLDRWPPPRPDRRRRAYHLLLRPASPVQGLCLRRRRPSCQDYPPAILLRMTRCLAVIQTPGGARFNGAPAPPSAPSCRYVHRLGQYFGLPALSRPLPCVSDWEDIKRAELTWAARSLADELAALHAGHVRRDKARDRVVVKLRVAQSAPDAEEIPPTQAA
jgi:hypothetical protein